MTKINLSKILYFYIFTNFISFNVNLFCTNNINESTEQRKLVMMQNFYKDKNVLVTGGAGFIGSHIVEELVKLGAKVSVVDDLSTGKLENLNQVLNDNKNNITFITGNITDYKTCLKVTENIDTVFHLAAYTSVPGSMQEPLKCYEINVQGTVNILEASRVNGVKNFVFSSSSAVYGNQNRACSEDLKCEPSSIYGMSKLIGEIYCEQYKKSFNLNTVCLRYFNVYGDRQVVDGPYAAVYVKFQNALKNNQKITIFGDGKQRRDFVSVKRIAQANLMAAYGAQKVAGEVFNVASGKSLSVLELLETLKKDFPNYCHQAEFLPARAGDILISTADCSKLAKFEEILG